MPNTAAPLVEFSPVTVIPGVGTVVSKLLDRSMGIVTLSDLARSLPARYDDRSDYVPIGYLQHGEMQCARGVVTKVTGRPALIKVTIEDETGEASLLFFNQWYLKTQWDNRIGQTIAVWGKATRSGRRTDFTDLEWERSEEEGPGIITGRIVPVYPLTKGLTQARMRQMQFWLWKNATDCFQDPVPQPIRDRQGLTSRRAAVENIHWPSSFCELGQARRRITFDEYLCVQLVLARRRAQHVVTKGASFQGWPRVIEEIRSALPYPLTGAQGRVLEELAADMRTGRVMHRLVQGDVGAGKSVVALAAMLLAVRNGCQAAIMAPTEILAEQHYRVFGRFAERLNFSIALITGSMPAKERNDVVQQAGEGSANIVVGTHALFQDSVTFKRLGLVVVDEQHRFGVTQRSALHGKGKHPHLLVMTATPIPRSLTLTVYGDLDISVIDELPPGRKPIKTHWKKSSERDGVYDALRSLLEQGRQAYVICSRVEEGEPSAKALKAAKAYHKHLSENVLVGCRVGLMHGQMKRLEKETVMAAFRDGEIDILIATTVVEVGVDVPNASIIVIEDAHRFGLSQLHQLRGRVGRGAAKSYCVLIGDAESATAQQRLTTMTHSSDGFRIAEEDLKLRGPGDYFGTRQSGAPEVPLMDYAEGLMILQQAREEAIRLTEEGVLDTPQGSLLRRIVDRKQDLMANFAAH